MLVPKSIDDIIIILISNIVFDKDLFESANKQADEMIANKKLFNDPEYQSLLQLVDENYKNNKEMLD